LAPTPPQDALSANHVEDGMDHLVELRIVNAPAEGSHEAA
jgi:hypothetical protein